MHESLHADVWVRADKSAAARVMTSVSMMQHMYCVTMYIQLHLGGYTLCATHQQQPTNAASAAHVAGACHMAEALTLAAAFFTMLTYTSPFVFASPVN